MVGVAEIELPVTMLGEPEHVVERFLELVRGGQSPRMAEILATRTCPGTQTDHERMKGLPSLNQLRPVIGNYAVNKIKSEAAAAGIHVSENSHYNGTMADQRCGGDPKAWIHAGDGISTFKNRLRDIGGGSTDLDIAPDMARVAEREAVVQKNFHARERAKKAYETARNEAIIKHGIELKTPERPS